MNKENMMRKNSYTEMVNRITKPKVQMLSLEKARLDLNRLISNCNSLTVNPEIEEKGRDFDNLLNSYYDLNEI